MRRGRKFELDRANGKFMGVCAGLAEATGWDATLIRVAVVVATIAFPWTLLGYLVAAWLGRPKAVDRYDDLGAPFGDRSSFRKSSAFEVRRTTTDLDRRLAEVETYVTTQNNSLAREIESLR
jgi:phage shock protein C